LITTFSDTLLSTVHGKAFNLLGMKAFPAVPEDGEQMAAWMPKITKLASNIYFNAIFHDTDRYNSGSKARSSQTRCRSGPAVLTQ
jgi:hypothetical protein